MAKKKSNPTLDELMAKFNKQSQQDAWEKDKVEIQVGDKAINQEHHERISTKRLPGVTGLDKDNLRAVIDAIVNFDPIHIIDQESNVLLKDIPYEARICIKSLEIKELIDNDGYKYGEIKKISFWSKEAAVDLATKVEKMVDSSPPPTQNNFIIVESLKKGFNRLEKLEESPTPIDVTHKETTLDELFEETTPE